MKQPLAAMLAIAMTCAPAHAIPACSSFYQSGRLVAMANGRTYQNFVINSDGGQGGFSYGGFSNVGILNAIIHYCSTYGAGVSANTGGGNWMQNVQTIDDCAPATHYNPSTIWNTDRAIDIEYNTGFVARNVLVTNPGTGFFLYHDTDAQLTGIQGTNIRGYSGSGGNFVQFDNSSHGSLTNFYAYNDLNISWTEDIVSNYRSNGTVVSGGLIDGANSPTGSCIQADKSSTNMSVSGVQCQHALNQCFGAYGASGVYNINYSYVGCQNMIPAASSPRGAPSSGGFPFIGAAPGSETGYVSFENVTYSGIPSGLVSTGTIALIEAVSGAYTPITPFQFQPPCQ